MIDEAKSDESGVAIGALQEKTSVAEAVPIEDLLRQSKEEEGLRLEREIARQAIEQAQRAKTWWLGQPWFADTGHGTFHYAGTAKNGAPLRLVVETLGGVEKRGTIDLTITEYRQDPEAPDSITPGNKLSETRYEFPARGSDIGMGQDVTVGRIDREVVEVANGNDFSPPMLERFWTTSDAVKYRGKGHPIGDARRMNDILEKARLLGEEKGFPETNGVPNLIPVVRTPEPTP